MSPLTVRDNLNYTFSLVFVAWTMKDFAHSVVLCNLLPPHGLCSWSLALVVANLGHKLLCVSGLHMNTMARNYCID